MQIFRRDIVVLQEFLNASAADKGHVELKIVEIALQIDILRSSIPLLRLAETLKVFKGIEQAKTSLDPHP